MVTITYSFELGVLFTQLQWPQYYLPFQALSKFLMKQMSKELFIYFGSDGLEIHIFVLQ